MIRAEVQLDPEIIQTLVQEHYGLPVLSLQKVRAIYKVFTPYGAFGFKNAEELPDLPLVARLLDRIRLGGFDRIPSFLRTIRGSYLVIHDNQTYFMEKWVELPEVPKLSYPNLASIGWALADFHRSAQGIIPPTESPRFEWGKRKGFLAEALRKLRQWKRYRNKPEENKILDFLFYRCNWALESIRCCSPQRLSARCPDAAVLCHAGLHHKNILVDHQNKIWFIDFETLTYAERVMDLAQLLQYHASAYRWNPAVVNRFLYAYMSRIPAPLAPDEWKLFFSYLAFPRRFYNRMVRYFDSLDRPPELLLKLQETMDQDLEKEYYLQKIQEFIS
ncbi:hypothetical protein E5161_01355 [Cohnella pontilimi]|uniref:Aminoglycoside phosphotransferase domain-containing protein n=1 Tax=Cohnella pontilimi TaxID=2564100 RepID=A0A4U0FGF4_9BACL|nr:phosphotransferase [Cohnella pontilimi]TJY44073.1 hypothetical protein E5161_01355 [Cohnella pontilimi]